MNSQAAAITGLTFGTVALLSALIFAVWLALRYIVRAFESIAEARPRTRPLLRLLESTLRIALWFGVLTFALRRAGLSDDELLVLMGAAAIAVGFGARDLVRSLIGGLVIIGDRPYEVGDRMTMAGTSGSIQRIGLWTTKIATPDGAVAIVPNAKLLDGVTQKESAGTPECAVATSVVLPADVDQDLALRVAREVLTTCPYVCLRRPTTVKLAEAPSHKPYTSLRLEGYVYDHRFGSLMTTDLICRWNAAVRSIHTEHH